RPRWKIRGRRQKSLDDLVTGVGETVNDVEMMSAGFLDRAGLRAEPGPDVGKQGVLADEFRTLRTADPAGHPGPPYRLKQRRALCQRFCLVYLEVRIHGGPQQRAKVMDAGDGDRIADA